VIRRFPGGGWALRLVIFLGPIVALLAASPQGRTPPTWLVVVVGIFSFAFAVMPEHYVGNGALAIVVAWWTVEMEDGLPLSSIAAAAALLAAHLAGTLASYGPARLAPDAGAVLLWARRGVLVSINSDDAEEATHLNQEAAKTIKFGGLSRDEALKLVTLNPAIQLGIDKRVGSIDAEGIW